MTPTVWLLRSDHEYWNSRVGWTSRDAAERFDSIDAARTHLHHLDTDRDCVPVRCVGSDPQGIAS